MLQANQFAPVAFDATVVAFDLTKSVGRLAARLLTMHGDLIDDEMGLHVPRRSATGGPLQLLFRDQGLLTVMPLWARFEGSLPEDVKLDSDVASESVKWAVELLTSVAATQKTQVMALHFEATWYLPEQASIAPLVDYLGLSKALGGFFAASEDFEIRGDTTAMLPDLFPVACELFAGRLANYSDPDNTGVQIKHRSPDNRLDSDDAPVNFDRATVDQFFAASPRLMQRQLEQFFPVGGAT